jgi:hypothetical protein
MKRLLFCLLVLVCCRPSARAVEMLRPEQLKPGMKGYGLSVFNGTKPERFEVEVLGVLKNTFPKQDMILIRMSGANLEKHKIIAGMSGSPIYIEDKLIGALAYGWSFENDPLAGVTPIHNMLAELNRPLPKLQTSHRSGAAFAALPPFAPANSSRDDNAAPRPLLTPLALGGFSPRMIELVSQKLQRFGLLPIAAGGGAGDSSTELRQPRARIEPGSALGVQLIRGDLNATAVGTATYVDKNKILAFGHPFFQGGRVEAPAVLAEVHTIMSSLAVSFKMATSVAEIGSMVGDWQSCIVADTKVKAAMIPVTVQVVSPDTGHSEHYAMEVIDNESFSPLLVQMAIAEAIAVASGSSQETTVRVALEAELSDRTVRVADTFFNPAGGLLDPDSLAPLIGVFSTPFGHPKVKRIDVKVDAALTRQTAEIKRAYFSKSQVQRGEHVPLSVVLKPFGQPEVTKTIEIEVPAATDSMRELSVNVMAGSKAPADIAPPDNMSDFLDAIQKEHRSTDLVVLVQSPTQGLQYRGKLLKRLPASALAVLDDSSRSDVINAADIQQLVVPTDWVLSGQANVRVPIRQE